MKQRFLAEIKKKAIEDYKNNRRLIDIQNDYNIGSPATILMWVNKYEQVGDLFLKDKQEETLETREKRYQKQINNKNNEIEILKNEINRLKNVIKNDSINKEIHDLQKELKKKNNEVEAWKKYITSFLGSKLLQIKDKRKNKINYSKAELHQIYCLVSELVESGNDAKPILKLLQVTETSFSRWKTKGKKLFERKYHAKAKEAVFDYYNVVGNVGGLQKAKLWIAKKYNIIVSRQVINEIRVDLNIEKYKKINSKKENRKNHNYSHNKYVANDLIQHNYQAEYYLQKVGMDGTWIKIYIQNILMKFLIEIAYDFYSSEVVSFAIDRSENSQVIIKVIKGVSNKMKIHKIKKVILHCDQGSGNTSQIVYNLCRQLKIQQSMSHSGFKGNQKTEGLNRWIKNDFNLIYGNKFNSEQEFINTFTEYINLRNSTFILLKSKLSPNEMIYCK